MSQAEFDARIARVRAALMRHEARGELLPGTSDALSRLWVGHGNLGPGPLAAKVAEMLASPPVHQRFANPEFVEPLSPSGSEAGPLRVAVRRLAPDLRDGVEDQLVAEWGVKFSHLRDGAKLIGAVVGELNRRETAERFARVLPEIPESERRVGDVLRRHFPDVDPAARDRLARERGSEMVRLDEATLVRQVAKALSLAPVAARYGAAPLAPDDPRQNAVLAPGPADSSRPSTVRL